MRRATFERELAVVRASGAHTEIEKLLRPTRNGRPRALAVDVFLTAAILSIGKKKQGGTLKAIHRLLTRSLDQSYRVQLGITKRSPNGEVGKSITIRQVRYLLERIEYRLTVDTRRQPDLDEHDQADRMRALQHISNLILAATMPSHLGPATEYAVDASAIRSWARGKRGNKEAADEQHDAQPTDDEVSASTEDDDVGESFDRGARWGYQTSTFEKGTKFMFGRQAVATGRVNHAGPPLVERLNLAPGNTNGVDAAREMITEWQAERASDGTAPITKVLCDRGFSDAVPERWVRHLNKCQIEQVLDIHPNQHGLSAVTGHDYVMIDGWPHHKSIPEHLRVINRPIHLSAGALKVKATASERRAHQERVDKLAKFRRLIAERDAYAFVRHTGPNPNAKDPGAERFHSPCCLGKIKDPICPLAPHLPDSIPAVTYEPGAEPRKHRRTVTVPGKAAEKLRQRLRWGSDDWIAEYSKRGAIEGQFGNWKNPATEAVKRGWIRVVGHVKTTVMLTLAVAASNLRQLRKWAKRTGDFTDPKTRPVKGRGYGHEEVGPDGRVLYPLSGIDPPGVT